MLYSDYFNGFLDITVSEGGNKLYADMADKLAAVAKSSRKYGYIFDSASKLCDLLSIKYELGVKTRAAYKAGNKDELLRLANEDYTELYKKFERFYTALEKQWTFDNKHCGFEVQESRIGGMLLRTKACKKRLLDYVSGKLDSIQELERELNILEGREAGKSMYYNNYRLAYSANVM
jgi:hypothetical protein